MQLTHATGIISAELEEVEKVLEENTASEIPLVEEISQYLLGSGGKRIRPCVLLLASGACGLRNGKERILSAAAVELIHTASLLHDDVVDEAKLRRGRTSPNIVWGNKASVLVGDFMLARALELLNACGMLELFRSVTRSSARLAEGQVLEVMSSTRLIDYTEELYLTIVERKTASLIECSGEAGAILAGAPAAFGAALRQYGLNLGIAFQITDDALDYSANEEEFGKAIGQDLGEGKITLPLLYSLRQASQGEREAVKGIIESGAIGKEEIDYVFNIVERYNGVARCLKTAERYAEAAKKSLSSLPESPYLESLASIADFVKERRV
ncbi:MAG: polyprenyl synthetase family protein [Candidatus Methanosuratincola sp.]|jgi:octaprenyl-diphosphate synthase